MKNSLFSIVVLFLIVFTSCESVDSGHRAAAVGWGGKTDMSEVYSEGMHTGFRWITDDLVAYDVREKTITQKFTFNDRNNMSCPVEFSLDFSLVADKVNYIHSKIGADQIEVKIIKTLSSAAMQVVPKYSASELNLSKREEAERLVSDILNRELPEFYVNFARIRITDVDIPEEIAKAAIATAKQAELNKLAESKAVEAENNFKAAEWDAKTKDILSQPAMLKLKELEIDQTWANKGVSKYGNNNVFGSETAIIKSLK